MRKPTKKFPGVYLNTTTTKYGYRTRVGVDETGKVKWQRREGFETARDAFEAKNKVSSSVRAGTHATPKRTTVVELVEADLDTQVKLGRMRESTAAGKRELFNRNVKPTLGRMRAQDLRASHLDTLYADLLANGRRRATARHGPGLGPSTVRLVHALLSGTFNRAVRRGDLATNPCARATPPGASTDETPTWSLVELQEFLAHPEVQRDPDRVLWRLMAATGVRRGEALAIGWDDIDLDSGVIHVRHGVVLVDGEVRIGPPKTKSSERRIKIGPETVQTLREHLAEQRERRVAVGAGWTDHGLVFPRVDGRPRSPVHASHAFRALVAKTGLPVVTLHALRHAHATLLLDQGQRVHDVAARLGHDPAVLLRRYAHHDTDSQDAAASMERLLVKSARPELRVVGEDG
jgi:integrase